MSKTMTNILKIQETTGINLVKQQIEADYYGDPQTPEQIEETLKNDEGYQKFLYDLENDRVPF